MFILSILQRPEQCGEQPDLRPNPLGSVKEAFGRGFGAGAATSAINYLSDLIGQKPVGSGVKAELLSGITGAAVSPFAAMRDPRRGCGSASPFTFSLGYGTAKGYRYDTPQTTNQPQSQRRGFSLKAFLGETLLGGLTGGFTSAAFYGAGKGIERVKESVRSRIIDGDDLYPSLSLNLDVTDDSSVNMAMEIAGPSTPEVFKVFGHGSPESMRYNGKDLNAKEVADIIRECPEFIGGKQKVLLYSCNTGQNPNGFAQQLADNLGVIVVAPTTEIHPLKSGEFLVANVYGKFGRKFKDPGALVPFMPYPKR